MIKIHPLNYVADPISQTERHGDSDISSLNQSLKKVYNKDNTNNEFKTTLSSNL